MSYPAACVCAALALVSCSATPGPRPFEDAREGSLYAALGGAAWTSPDAAGALDATRAIYVVRGHAPVPETPIEGVFSLSYSRLAEDVLVLDGAGNVRGADLTANEVSLGLGLLAWLHEPDPGDARFLLGAGMEVAHGSVALDVGGDTVSVSDTALAPYVEAGFFAGAERGFSAGLVYRLRFGPDYDLDGVDFDATQGALVVALGAGF